MSSAVVELPALCQELFDESVLERTIKFKNTDFYVHVHANDVIEALKILQINPQEIQIFSKGTNDKEVSVVAVNTETLAKVKVAQVVVNEKVLTIQKAGRAVIGVRVHWLPLYCTNSLVEAILGPYGKILSVGNGKITGNGKMFSSGVRVVQMEVSDLQMTNLPYLLKFECGAQALLTVVGRPPLCLKCYKVGHYKTSCSGTSERSNFYSKVRDSISEKVQQQEEEKKKERIENIRKEVEETTRENAKRQEVQRKKEQQKRPERQQRREEEKMEEEDRSRGKKRDKEEEEKVENSFEFHFPRQKSRKPSVAPSETCETSQFDDLLEDTPLIVAEFASESSESGGATGDSQDMS